MEYYECHITMIGNPERIAPKVKKLKWKFSAIDGDPTLGKGIKCYATRHFNAKMEPHRVLDELVETANELVDMGCEVIRRKIENVIFDDRSKTVRFDCNGGCPECHLDDIKENYYGEENYS